MDQGISRAIPEKVFFEVLELSCNGFSKWIFQEDCWRSSRKNCQMYFWLKHKQCRRAFNENAQKNPKDITKIIFKEIAQRKQISIEITE